MTERYKRQEMMQGWNQGILSKSKVIVIGAGTTGNEVIKNLALLGVGLLGIVDKDIVEEVNLSRCVLFRQEDVGKPKAEIAAKRAKEMNPYGKSIPIPFDVVHNFGCLEYKSYDCVILTVDNLAARMWVNRYCWLNRVPLINTGIDGWIGNVAMMVPPFRSCIECAWTNKEYRRLGEEHSCSRIGLSPHDNKIPMVVTSAAVVGGIAAQEATKILLGLEQGSSAHNTHWFDGRAGAFLSWQQGPRTDCAHHYFLTKKSRDILFETSLDDDVGNVKQRIRLSLHCSLVEIKHDKEIVYSIMCRSCGYRHAVTPCLIGNFRRSLCPKCSELEVVPDEYTEELKEEFTLRSLFIPPNHLLNVCIEKDGSTRNAWIVTKN